METRTITIRVSPEAATTYETAPAEQKRKLDALLSLKLTEVGRVRRERVPRALPRRAGRVVLDGAGRALDRVLVVGNDHVTVVGEVGPPVVDREG